MPRVRPKEVCQNCKRKKPINALGRCSACYNYWWRNGIQRPQWLIKRIEACTDCREGIAYCKGRCRTCYNYFAANGKKRPSHLRRKEIMDCRNPACQKPLRLCKHSCNGYCPHCHDYRRKNDDADRPARYARFELEPGYMYCENPNCDKPLKVGRNRGARCHACLNWLRANWEERPREICPQRVTLGWCECGKVARRIVPLGGLGASRRVSVELVLCEDCYDLIGEGDVV